MWSVCCPDQNNGLNIHKETQILRSWKNGLPREQNILADSKIFIYLLPHNIVSCHLLSEHSYPIPSDFCNIALLFYEIEVSILLR